MKEVKKLSNNKISQAIIQRIEAAKAEWELTVDALPELVCLLDGDKVLRANRMVEEWELAKITEINGMDMHKLMHPECSGAGCYFANFLKDAREKIKSGKMMELETRDEILNKYVNIRLRPMASISKEKGERKNLTVLIISDITEQKEMGGRLVSLYKHLGTINRRVSILKKLGETKEKDKEEIIKNILWSALEFFQAEAAVLYRSDDEKECFQSLSFISNGNAKQRLKEKVREIPFCDLEELREALRKKKDWIGGQVDNFFPDLFFPQEAGKYFVAIPLMREGNLSGALTLFFPREKDVFGQEFDFLSVFMGYAFLILSNFGILLSDARKFSPAGMNNENLRESKN